MGCIRALDFQDRFTLSANKTRLETAAYRSVSLAEIRSSEFEPSSVRSLLFCVFAHQMPRRRFKSWGPHLLPLTWEDENQQGYGSDLRVQVLLETVT